MTNYECENRISDDEIISSLEVIATTRNCSECKIRNCNWGDCNCSQITANAALDLINRQKAEIEILNNNISSMAVTMRNSAKATRNEAIKWFAERLKEEIDTRPTHSNEQNKYVCFLIDSLVEEMAGDTE